MEVTEVTLKTCKYCGDAKPLELFTKRYTKRTPMCKKCMSEYIKGRMKSDPEAYEQQKRNSKAAHYRAVNKVLDHYGRKCECCGETEQKFLTVDHIEAVGSYQKRLAMGHNTIYLWLVRHNFPPGFRILCSNCNHGRARNNGICPHQEGSQASAIARSRKCGEVPDTLIPQGKDMVEAAVKAVDVPFEDWSHNPVWPFTPLSQTGLVQ